jgi:hypothetical protein
MDVPRIAMHSLCPEHADVHESSNFSLLSALRGVNHKGRQKKKRAWLNKRKTASFVYRKKGAALSLLHRPKSASSIRRDIITIQIHGD